MAIHCGYSEPATGCGHHVRGGLVQVRLSGFPGRCVQSKHHRLERFQPAHHTIVAPASTQRGSWRATEDLTGLVHHADPGSPYLSLRHYEQLTDLGIRPSTQTVGGHFDNVLAETAQTPVKTELIKPRKPSAPSKKSNSLTWNTSSG